MSTTTASRVTQAKLVSKREVAERTMAFHFEKPSDWTFEAGQCLDMTLLDPKETDAEGNTRSFTIASSPGEETLMIATRLRDTAFKRVLNTLPLGSEVRIEGPWGTLTLTAMRREQLCFWQAASASLPFAALRVTLRRRSSPIESSCSTPTVLQRTRRFSMSFKLWKRKTRSSS